MTFHKKHGRGQGMPSAAESSSCLPKSNKNLLPDPENWLSKQKPFPEDLGKAFAFRLHDTASRL